MPNLTMSIPHQLSRAEARQRVGELVGQVQKLYGGLGRVEERWEGDTMTFTHTVAGLLVTGKVFVEDQAVRLDVVLPMALALLAGGVKQKVEQEGRKLLARRTL